MFLQTKQKINNVGEIAWELNSLRSGNFYREFRGISEVKYYLLLQHYDADSAKKVSQDSIKNS